MHISAVIILQIMKQQAPQSYLSLSFVISGVIFVYGVAFLLTRLHMFNQEYSKRLQEHNNDKWLIQQCSFSEFYHNMKHHSDICEDVTMKMNESLWLIAADHVARHSYLCGYSSCASLLEGLINWMLGRGVIITCIVGGFVMVLPSIMLPFWRQRQMAYGHAIPQGSVEDARVRYFENFHLT